MVPRLAWRLAISSSSAAALGRERLDHAELLLDRGRPPRPTAATSRPRRDVLGQPALEIGARRPTAGTCRRRTPGGRSRSARCRARRPPPGSPSGRTGALASSALIPRSSFSTAITWPRRPPVMPSSERLPPGSWSCDCAARAGRSPSGRGSSTRSSGRRPESPRRAPTASSGWRRPPCPRAARTFSGFVAALSRTRQKSRSRLSLTPSSLSVLGDQKNEEIDV